MLGPDIQKRVDKASNAKRVGPESPPIRRRDALLTGELVGGTGIEPVTPRV